MIDGSDGQRRLFKGETLDNLADLDRNGTTLTAIYLRLANQRCEAGFTVLSYPTLRSAERNARFRGGGAKLGAMLDMRLKQLQSGERELTIIRGQS